MVLISLSKELTKDVFITIPLFHCFMQSLYNPFISLFHSIPHYNFKITVLDKHHSQTRLGLQLGFEIYSSKIKIRWIWYYEFIFCKYNLIMKFTARHIFEHMRHFFSNKIINYWKLLLLFKVCVKTLQKAHLFRRKMKLRVFFGLAGLPEIFSGEI